METGVPERRVGAGVSLGRREDRPVFQHRAPVGAGGGAAGLLDRLGQAKYSGLHALRHFYASWCINRKDDGGLELPAKIVQARLGHASIVMTMDTYGHLFPSQDDGAELASAERTLLG